MTENKNGLTLVEQDKLGYLELHLAEAVKNSPYSKAEQEFIKELRKEINYDFIHGKYDYSATKALTASYYQASIQFKLDGDSLVPYLQKLYLTSDEVGKLVKKATDNGDLINTQGLYDGEDAYLSTRFQDPRQPKLRYEAYIGFDFNYVPTEGYEDRLSDLKESVNNDISTLKKSIADVIDKISDTTTTITSKEPDSTTTTSTSTVATGGTGATGVTGGTGATGGITTSTTDNTSTTSTTKVDGNEASQQ